MFLPCGRKMGKLTRTMQVVLEIVIKEYPYSECTNQAQIYKKVTSGIRPQGLLRVADEDTKQFIELCLTFDPRRRPAAAELLQHPYLATMGDQAPSSVNLFDGMQSSLSGDSLGLGTALGPSPLVQEPLTNSPTESDHPQAFDSIPRQTQSSVGSNSIRDSPNQTVVVDAENHTFLISERPRLRSLVSNLDTYCVVECKDRPSEDEVTLKMMYGITGGPVSEIVFPFKLSEDTATDVVSEMIRENLIDEHDEQLTRRKLEEAVRLVLLGQIRSTSVELLSRRWSPSSSPTLFPSQKTAPPPMEPLSSAEVAPIPISQPSVAHQPRVHPTQTPEQSFSNHSVPSAYDSPNSQFSRSPAMSATLGSTVSSDRIPSMEPLPRPMMMATFPTPAPSTSASTTTPQQDQHLTLVGSPLSKAASFVDPAVQSKLKELQELNLKGLGSLELNASANSNPGPRPAMHQRTVSRTSSYSSFSEQWPLTFGSNPLGTGSTTSTASLTGQPPHLSPVQILPHMSHVSTNPINRTNTMPILQPSPQPISGHPYPQGGGTLPRSQNQMQSPMKPRPQPLRSNSDHNPLTITPGFPYTPINLQALGSSSSGSQPSFYAPGSGVPPMPAPDPRSRTISSNSNVSAFTTGSERDPEEWTLHPASSQQQPPP